MSQTVYLTKRQKTCLAYHRHLNSYYLIKIPTCIYNIILNKRSMNKFSFVVSVVIKALCHVICNRVLLSLAGHSSLSKQVGYTTLIYENDLRVLVAWAPFFNLQQGSQSQSLLFLLASSQKMAKSTLF